MRNESVTFRSEVVSKAHGSNETVLAGGALAAVASRGVRLTLDHVILRAADPAAALRELSERAGAPVLVEPHDAGAFVSGIVRAGALDIEVLRIGAEPPERVQGYGLGFAADVPVREALRELRAAGFATSVPTGATANGRRWRAIQVHGLLPDPFPAPVSSKAPDFLDRATESAAGVLGRIPAVARAATRKAGASMVVVTEYDFDADAWRAEAGEGPDVFSVEVGTGGHDWSALPIEPGPLLLHRDGPPGVRRVVFEGDGESFRLGDVEFEFSSAA
jgi:hypothetical protein